MQARKEATAGAGTGQSGIGLLIAPSMSGLGVGAGMEGFGGQADRAALHQCWGGSRGQQGEQG